MGSDTLRSNAGLDKAVTKSTNFEQLRENLLQELERQGTIQRDRTDAHGVRLTGPVVLDGSGSSGVREILRRRVAVGYQGGASEFEIEGSSAEELDAKEAAIRAKVRTEHPAPIRNF